ncbi:MAG TPA: prepilin-type N-terminal cleavage/methylation domain-containing protein [Pyrinomonadaceae bacterium]|nr:prepilin-type N-terminal cleavage/methylation domain-containing protein [Pyrinomonadaceae bacterium]
MKVKVKTTNRNGERGFTLIETSISMVVMMVAGLAVSSLFVFSMQNNVGGNERALAMAVAQQQLEQLRSVSFEDTTMAVGTTTTTINNGDQPYSVVKTITSETNPNGSAKELRKITIVVTPLGGSRGEWTRTPVTLVSLRSTLAPGPFAVP